MDPTKSSTESVTRLLQAWRHGDSGSLDRLASIVYDELKGVARRSFSNERSGHTLQPTALVHEVFLRLVESDVDWQDRAHFFAVAATAMRRVLVDSARSKRSAKRGGDADRLSLHEGDGAAQKLEVDLLDLNVAIDRLQKKDPEQARMIELFYFAGLSYPDIAEVLGTSRASVGRELRFAKTWLRRRLVGVESRTVQA